MTGTMIIGEAWGKEEAEAGLPFVGPSGKLLNGLLSQVGISRGHCYVTNVFNFQPDRNDLKTICGKKAEGIPGFPALSKGGYVLAQYSSELDRLFTEIIQQKPTLIIALGATATWALLKHAGIKSIRGAPLLATVRDQRFKVFPTYHPSAVLREWKLRPILLADLTKARRESEYPEVRRPKREVWIEPSYDDLLRFEQEYILPSPYLSIDIETAGDQITCIGFAPSIDRTLVVPFFDSLKASKSYWPTVELETQVWNWVLRICHLKKTIVGQNFLYDMNFLWTKYGITVPHAAEDTMLLHHALQPEMEKGLGFQGSIYTDEQAWKTSHRKKHNETLKRED
jgi:uracil-DNA glycosylase